MDSDKVSNANGKVWTLLDRLFTSMTLPERIACLDGLIYEMQGYRDDLKEEEDEQEGEADGESKQDGET
jgi:hypothetical protein